MTEALVRVASLLDKAALLTINVELQALHFAARPDQFKPVDPPRIERWLQEVLADPAATLWVAQLDGAVVGSALVTRLERADGPFRPTRAWWYIDQVGVLAAHRRRGVARALVTHVLDAARAHGITQIELNSWAFNRDAHAAFGSLGFVPKFTRFELTRPLGQDR